MSNRDDPLTAGKKLAEFYRASLNLLEAAQRGDVTLTPLNANGMAAYQAWAAALDTAYQQIENA